MGDETKAKIDRFFNFLDAGIEEATHLLTRGQMTGRVIDRAKAERQQMIDAEAREPDARDVRPAPPRARASRVRIIESIDAISGAPTFVITDGVSRSECPTRELAERIATAMGTP